MKSVIHTIFKLRGIIKDIEPVELMNGVPPHKGFPTPAVWTGGSNIHFDKESTHRVGGYAGFADPMPVGAVPIFQMNVLTPDISYWMWVDIAVPSAPLIWVTDGTSHFDITPVGGLTGGGVGEWTGAILNGVPVLNNGIDAPIWWDGATSNPMDTLPGWPENTLAKSIRAYKYHLVAMNLTENGLNIPEKYMWSDAADPGSVPEEWESTPENEAGFNTLSATAGGIVDGLKLRGDFMIYKQHSTYIMSYVAGQFVFNVRSLFVTTGIQALNCVKELRGRHYVFADDDVIVTDGNSFDSIIDNQMRDLLFNGINPDNHHMCHLAINVPTDEVWIVAPSVDSELCDYALVHSFEDGVWGVRELPETAYVADGIVPVEDIETTWDGSTTEWIQDLRRWADANYSVTSDRLIMNSPNQNRLFNVDAAFDNAGEPLQAYVERTDWVLGGQEAMWVNNLVQAVYPIITGTDGDVVKVRVAGTQVPGGAVPWSAEQDYVIGADTFQAIKLDVLTHGRMFNIRFSSAGGSPWSLHRMGVEYIPMSKY